MKLLLITSYAILGMACLALAEKPGLRPCPAGFFGEYTPNGLICKPCPAGTIAPSIGTTQCEPCPAYTVPDDTATKCVDPTSIQTKIPCQPGFFDTDGEGNCEPCPSGSISQEANQRECEPCIGGKVPNEYRTQCINGSGADEDVRVCSIVLK